MIHVHWKVLRQLPWVKCGATFDITSKESPLLSETYLIHQDMLENNDRSYDRIPQIGFEDSWLRPPSPARKMLRKTINRCLFDTEESPVDGKLQHHIRRWRLEFFLRSNTRWSYTVARPQQRCIHASSV